MKLSAWKYPLALKTTDTLLETCADPFRVRVGLGDRDAKQRTTKRALHLEDDGRLVGDVGGPVQGEGVESRTRRHRGALLEEATQEVDAAQQRLHLRRVLTRDAASTGHVVRRCKYTPCGQTLQVQATWSDTASTGHVVRHCKYRPRGQTLQVHAMWSDTASTRHVTRRYRYTS